MTRRPARARRDHHPARLAELGAALLVDAALDELDEPAGPAGPERPSPNVRRPYVRDFPEDQVVALHGYSRQGGDRMVLSYSAARAIAAELGAILDRSAGSTR